MIQGHYCRGQQATDEESQRQALEQAMAEAAKAWMGRSGG